MTKQVTNGVTTFVEKEVEVKAYCDTLPEAKKKAYTLLQGANTVIVHIAEYNLAKVWVVELDVLKMDQIK